MKIEQTPASTYFQIIESGCHKRLHSVHRPSCRAVDCDSSDIRFCNVRSPVQWLTADSITGKENAILVFKIDSRFEHCTCLHHCVAITEIVNRNFRIKSKEIEHLPQCGFQSMSFARSFRIYFYFHDPIHLERSYQPLLLWVPKSNFLCALPLPIS